MPIAIGVSVAILAVGAVTARLTRTADAPAVTAPVAVAAPVAPPLGAQEAQRTLALAGVGDLRAILRASGIAEADARAADAAVRGAMSDGGELRAVLTLSSAGAEPVLTRLQVSHPDGSGVIVSRDAAGGYAAVQVAADLTTRVVVRTGRMDADSFYSSAVAAGITDSLIPDFAKALAFDFDFQREVGAGDAFEAAFSQAYNAQGQAVGAPTLLYASLTTQTKSATVYRFDGAGEDGEWFDGSGRSVVRSLMRTPIDGARVSSRFGRRVHPVLGFQKMHNGTDFAAPTGTAIFASGNATVTWSGMKGANGNLVVLQHDNGWLTYYLHQNRIMPEVVVGARVSQGQKIGEVGTTGRSTGPHLHYEIRIDGQPVDSMSIQVDEGRTLSGPALIAFGKVREAIDLSRATPQG